MAEIAFGSRVFLAFDDFSLAGKHVLSSLESPTHPHKQGPRPLETLASDLRSKVQISHLSVSTDASASISLLSIDSASLTSQSAWEVADHLTHVLSDSNINELVIVAALHLPNAPTSDHVYYHSLHAPSKLDQTSALKSFGSGWPIADTFLAKLLHFLRVEGQLPTHLLLAKGYKPSQDASATIDAVKQLGEAVKTFDVQVQDIETLTKALVHSHVRPSQDPYAILYH